ncbi:DUF1415 domain-containing protein [Alteromonas lipolytica]|uniref:DUF1415 domain-containing protein n=1 Tax=Alteromonas lipolytica TaxID=1856405 RepID=A0A1E8F9F8_9ALTE|nr:DUF1415 domain-containing protein [Alteromonas lipolytica]OFI32549.1 hypothetical protein BFC17_05180 [Alteromonas lipolytica]GGF75197.1 DUF1415 domain-containing protein [Alteromonas lipolytica]
MNYIPPTPACEDVKRWLDTMVIGHNFCPFARFVRDQQRIRYVDIASDDMAEVLTGLRAEFDHLDETPKTSTTLVVLPLGWQDFEDYLLLVDVAQQSLEHWGYEGCYQLASFHPDYLFDGEPSGAASHFTNRAPHPVIHIIREAEMEQALAHHADPESIPQTNIETAESLGKKALQAQLDACKHRD